MTDPIPAPEVDPLLDLNTDVFAMNLYSHLARAAWAAALQPPEIPATFRGPRYTPPAPVRTGAGWVP